MLMSFEAFWQRAYRMRGVMDFVGTHLDDELRLEDLAEVACLSPAHFIRMYRGHMNEGPMQTLRRLRLQRAFDDIRLSRYRSITDAGIMAGYGSSAAFTHAFRKQFGYAPSEAVPNLPHLPLLSPLHLEFMPSLRVWQIPYEGRYADNGYFKTRLAWRYYRAGCRGWRGWRLNDRDHPFAEADTQHVQLTHFLPVLDPAAVLFEAEQSVLPGGLHAVVELNPADRDACMRTLAERVRTELGCQLTEGRSIERDLKIRDLLAPQERRIALYVPVAPLRRAARPRDFEPEPLPAKR